MHYTLLLLCKQHEASELWEVGIRGIIVYCGAYFSLCYAGKVMLSASGMGGGGGGECEGDTCVLCDMILFFVLCREDDAVCKGGWGGGEIIVYCVTS